MRFKEISNLLGYFLFIFSCVLVVPLGVAAYFDFFVEDALHSYPDSFYIFLLTLIVSTSLGAICKILGRGSHGNFFRKESILIVVLVWILTSVIGAMPFYFTKTLDSPLDALFESVSGFSTTGASIILQKKYDPLTGQEIPYKVASHDTFDSYTFLGTVAKYIDPFTGNLYEGFEAMPRPVLFWRSFIQWLGGIGVVFVFLALFPNISIGGKFLYQAEAHPALHESSDQEALRPRVAEVASYLWKIYLGLTLIEVLLLHFLSSDVPLFDAVCISLSNISTGGFAIHAENMAFYSEPITQWIIISFMLIGAMNFALYFYVLTGNIKKLWNLELLLFWIFVIVISFGVTIKLLPIDFLKDPIRAGCFQAISALTCTGFSTANYNLWPLPSLILMILAMYLGGMTGSTSGGIKTSRHIILFKSFKKKLEKIYRPNLIKPVKIGSTITDHSSKNTVFLFFWTIIVASVLSFLLYIIDGLDLLTALGLTGCNINNVGLTFNMPGPGNSCAFLSPFSKILSMILMLLGRLEFFTVFILLTPSFWKVK